MTRRRSKLFFVARVSVPLVMALTAAGCSWRSMPLAPAPTINSVQEAASIHIAELSVGRWEDAAAALQPQFGITPATALALALPRTSITQDAFASVLSGQLQVGLPQMTQTGSLNQTLANSLTTGNTATNTAGGASPGSTTTTTTTGSNGTSTSQTTTTSLAPGTLPSSLLTSPTAPNAAALAAPSGPVQLDPMLTYEAATAIYQEVQMLSSYIQSAALSYNSEAYLARAQISVVPFARNEPYDVYIDLGMFSKCWKAADKCTDSPNGADEERVRVIPLLVTDDLETGQASNAISVARQLALSLGGIVHNVALQSQLSDLQNKFEAVLGTDFNSLYTISRGAENVIQVRLGASRNPNLKEGYSMLTQTHNISFVLLVDRQYTPEQCALNGESSQIVMTSFARLRNANTGKELAIDRSLIDAQVATVMKRFEPRRSLWQRLSGTGALEETSLDELLSAVQTDDLCKFKSWAWALQLPSPEALWTGLTTVIDMSEYAGTHFYLPKRLTPPPGAESQTVFVHDNCKDSATATLAGLGSLAPGNFTAMLTWQTATGETASIAATSISQNAAGGPFTLQFPSLTSLRVLGSPLKSAIEKVCPDSIYPPPPPPPPPVPPKPAQPVELNSATLTLNQQDDSRWASATIIPSRSPAPSYTFDHIVYDSSALPDTSVSLMAAADSITNDGTGKGRVRLLIKGGKGLDDVALSIIGGSISHDGTVVSPTSPPPAVAAANAVTALAVNGGLLIKPLSSGKSGPNPGQIVLDVDLENLVAGRTVTVTATGEKGAGGAAKPVTGSSSTIEVPVLPLTNNISQPGGVTVINRIP
jgi:hypothetical protein